MPKRISRTWSTPCGALSSMIPVEQLSKGALTFHVKLPTGEKGIYLLCSLLACLFLNSILIYMPDWGDWLEERGFSLSLLNCSKTISWFLKVDAEHFPL